MKNPCENNFRIISCNSSNGLVTAVNDALLNRSEYLYSGKGQLLQTTQVAPGADRSFDAVTQMEYDSQGRLETTTDPEGNSTRFTYSNSGCSTCGGSTTPATSTDPFGKITTNLFDKNGRLVGVQTPVDVLNNTLTTLIRDTNGRVESRTDANGNTTRYQYDQLGRTILQIDANLGQTAFDYDSYGNLQTLTDPEQNITRFEYDLAGRKTKEIRPLLQETSYRYYKNGLLKTVKDGQQQSTSYSYDKGNRLTEVNYADNTQDTFSYDDNGNLTHWDNGSISGTLTYDELNRKTAETTNYGSFSKTTSTTYDHRSNKTSFTSPQGIVHSYEYQKNDRLQKISFDGQAIDLIHDKTRTSRINYGNGTSTDYTYNDNSWLQNISTNNNATPILSRDYQFDNTGNINQMQTQQGLTSYTYDDIYQLTAADHPDSIAITDEAYSYDQVGNRLTSAETSGTWSHNPNNELTDSTAATYTYDNNGNTTEKEENGIITTYIYNARNRLSQVLIDNIPIATYSYDPFGRRTSKTVNSITTWYLYADEGLIGEYSSTGTWQKSYGWYPDDIWGTNPLYQQTPTGLYYYHNDHLGTPQRLTNASTGTTAWSAGYAAFGKANIDPLSAVENNLRFPGQYYDSETNLHYNWNRTYDPTTGRYTQVDPIGFWGGDVNLYGYARRQPLNLIDWDGRAISAVVGTIGVTVGTAGTVSGIGAGALGYGTYKLTSRALEGTSLGEGSFGEFVYDLTHPEETSEQETSATTQVPDDPSKYDCGGGGPPDACVMACIRCVKGAWYEKTWACPLCVICVTFGGYNL